MDIDIVLLLTTTFDATSTNITTSPIVACFFRRWISSIKEMILLFPESGGAWTIPFFGFYSHRLGHRDITHRRPDEQHVLRT